MVRIRGLSLGVLFAGMAFVVGCSSDQSMKQLAAMNTTNIQRVSNLYAAYQNMVSSGGPKDEAEFKNFLKTYNPQHMTAMGVDSANLDKSFISERDNKPFKIRWKVGGGRGAVAPVVFEDTGVNGKKQVGFTNGVAEEVSDADYKALWEGKMSRPPSESSPTGPSTGAPAKGKTGGRPAGAPTGGPGG